MANNITSCGNPAFSFPSKALLPRPMARGSSAEDSTFITRESGVIILLLGRSGAGKSHFINVAAGKPVASVSEGLNADASELAVRHFTLNVQNPRRRDQALPDKLILVDTPGFDNYYHELNDAKILNRIEKWLTTKCSRDAWFGGIIWFHDIAQDRGAMEYNQTWPTAYLTDPEPVGHLLLTTAKWDRIPAPPFTANYEEREERLSRTVWSRMLSRGARVARFMNTEASAWAVLSQLLKLQPLELHILQTDLMRIKKRDQIKGGIKKRNQIKWASLVPTFDFLTFDIPAFDFLRVTRTVNAQGQEKVTVVAAGNLEILSGAQHVQVETVTVTSAGRDLVTRNITQTTNHYHYHFHAPVTVVVNSDDAAATLLRGLPNIQNSEDR